MEDVISHLECLAKPTIALVQGHAVGGGLALAAACDLRVCTPDARFGLPIARTVGNCLSMQGYARLASLLGPARAKEHDLHRAGTWRLTRRSPRALSRKWSPPTRSRSTSRHWPPGSQVTRHSRSGLPRKPFVGCGQCLPTAVI